MEQCLETSSDPLPYIQVDRAVKPVAAIVAMRLGVSVQHAIGGLIAFWDMCGDPRDLQRLLLAGSEEVVLTRDEAARRFELAMGVDCARMTPDDLHALRLLELRPDGRFRVRGMSRFFAPIKKRLKARLAASAGGKASAKARAERHGTAQPRSGAGSASASGVASESASESLRSAPEAQPEATVEAAPKLEDRGQRTEDILSEEEAPTPEAKPEAALRTTGRRARPLLPPDYAGTPLWVWFQDEREGAGFVREEPPDYHSFKDFYREALEALQGDETRLREAAVGFSRDSYWQAKGLPFAGFMSAWRKYVPRRE